MDKELETKLRQLHEIELELQEIYSKRRKESDRKDASLSKREYKRYSRHLLDPEWGMQKQLQLRSSKVLVLGAGGLGCPCVEFLAASGVGEITIVDDDDVEFSNLHRQVLHTEDRALLGTSKSASVSLGTMRINSDVVVIPIIAAWSPEFLNNPYGIKSDQRNIISNRITEGNWDLVIDATDNAATRYLANRYAVVHNIPFVSGAAVRGDGIVTSYPFGLNPDADDCPCYYCLFPYSNAHSKSQEIDNVDPTSQLSRLDDATGAGQCSDRGVLGITCALVGTQMANEALRLLLKKSKKVSITLYKPLGLNPITPVKKVRPKNPQCPVCAGSPEERYKAWSSYLSRVEQPSFNGVSTGVIPNADDRRITHEDFDSLRKDPNVSLIDVRVPSQYSICSLDRSINIPYEKLARNPSLIEGYLQPEGSKENKIVFLCRRGNDSLRVSRLVRSHYPSASEKYIVDLEGGLTKWAEYNPEFSMY